MNRVLVFILGMIFGVIFFFGAIAGVGYVAYVSFTLDTFGVRVDALGDLNTMTLQQVVNQAIAWSDTEGGVTVGDIETEWDLDFATLLQDLNPDLYEALVPANVFLLVQGDTGGFLDSISLGLPLAFVPEGIIKSGAYSQMKSITLADLLGFKYDTATQSWVKDPDADIMVSIRESFADVKLGAFLGEDFVETAVTNADETITYTYTPAETAEVSALMKGLANCTVGGFLSILDEDANVFQEIKDGALSSLGEVSLAEVLSFVEQADMFGTKKIADLIGTDDETNEANLDFMGIFNGMVVGDLLSGYTVVYDCDNTTEGHEHHITDTYKKSEKAITQVSTGVYQDADGKSTDEDGYFLDASGDKIVQEEGCVHTWYSSYTDDGVDNDTEADAIFGVLADASFDALLDGDIAGVFEGVYLGKLLGYSLTYDCGVTTSGHVHHVNDTYKKSEKAITQVSTGVYQDADGKSTDKEGYFLDTNGDKIVQEEGCVHTWEDADGDAPDALTGVLADISFSDIFSGNFEVTDALSDLVIGNVLKYTKVYDNYVLGVGAITGPDAAGKYFDSNNDEVDSAGYLIDEDGNRTPVENSTYKWYKTFKGYDHADNVLADALTNAFADVNFGEITDGGFEISSVVSHLYVGEIMNYTLTYNCATDHAHHVEDTYQKSAKTITQISAGVYQDADGLSTDANGYFLDANGEKIVDEAGCAHTWTDKNGKVTDEELQILISDIPLGGLLDGTYEITDTIMGVEIGSAMGLISVDDGSGNITWYTTYSDNDDDTDDKEANAIIAAIAPLTIEELSDSDTLNNTLDTLTIGEILNYTYAENSWWTKYDGVGALTNKPANSLLSAIADKNVASLKDGTAIDDIELGVVLGLTKGSDGVWYSTYNGVGNADNVEATGIKKALADITMNDLEGDDMLNSIEIGTILGYSPATTAQLATLGETAYYCAADCAVDHNGNGDATDDVHSFLWVDATGTPAEGIKKALADLTIGDLTGNAVNDISLGTILGYHIHNDDTDAYCDADCTTDHNGALEGNGHTYLWVDDDDDTPAKGIYKALAGLTVGDLSDSDKLNASIDDINLGELLSITDSSSGILKTLADKSVADLKSGTALDNVYLGEILDYTREDGHAGYCDADCTTDHNGDTEGNGHKYYWVDDQGTADTSDDAQALGVNGKLADLTISELSSGSAMTEKINTLTLRDVLGDATINSNTMLTLLANYEIGELGDRMNELYIGEIMGMKVIYTANATDYQLDTVAHDWREVFTDTTGYTVVVDGIMSKTEDGNTTYIMQTSEKYSYNEAGEYYYPDAAGSLIWCAAEYEDSIYSITEQNSISLTMSDTTISNVGDIPGKLTTSVTSITIGELMEMGVLTFDTPTITKLNTLFCPDSNPSVHVSGMCSLGNDAEAHAAIWKAYTMPSFITAIINLAG